MHARFHDETLEGTLDLHREWPVDGPAPVDRYLFVWNRGRRPARFRIDDTPVPLPPASILCLTPGPVVALEAPRRAGPGPDRTLDLVILGFDRPFYCVETHDHEVSCNGLLFNGALGAPVVALDEDETGRFGRLLHVIEEEFDTPETAQAEMLRLLLKRFIIRCTRMARRQLMDRRAAELEVELVRQYSALVDKHFRTHHRVSDYADLLFRSPKTLANAFRNAGARSPQEILLDRIALEARRLLHYTDRPVQRIARDLGFDDPAHFSRFFRRQTGASPTEFRRRRLVPADSGGQGTS